MTTSSGFMPRCTRPLGRIVPVALLVILAAPLVHAGARSDPQAATEKPRETPVYLRIEPARKLKVSHLKPRDVVEGRLANAVYRGDKALFPAGSRVRLTVDKLVRHRRKPNDYWPWVVRIFMPRHENYPTFRSATVVLPDGTEVPLSVSLLSIRKEKRIHVNFGAKAKGDAVPAGGAADPAAGSAEASSLQTPRPEKRRKNKRQMILTLEATAPPSVQAEVSPAKEPVTATVAQGPVTVAAGTQAQVILLKTLSASKSRRGDLFQARLMQPVWVASNLVLPEGTLVEGRVLDRTPPRILSRAGSLEIGFTRLILPGGEQVPVEASLAGAELDQRSHTRIDSEGELRGDHPGKLWMLINLGVTAGMAKESDDATQLIIGAIVSSATDASTAGTARIVGACVSGFFLLTRHGRDVVLPKFTEMTITFDHRVLLTSSGESLSAAEQKTSN